MSRLMFGYAALGQPEYLEALLGVVPNHFKAILRGYELCLQDYKDMPEQVKRIIDENWDPEFKSYFARRTSSEKIIEGIAWEITPEQERVLDDWEFEGLWYRKDPVKITIDGKECDAFVYSINDGIGKAVQVIDPFPVDKEKLLRLARENSIANR